MLRYTSTVHNLITYMFHTSKLKRHVKKGLLFVEAYLSKYVLILPL